MAKCVPSRAVSRWHDLESQHQDRQAMPLGGMARAHLLPTQLRLLRPCSPRHGALRRANVLGRISSCASSSLRSSMACALASYQYNIEAFLTGAEGDEAFLIGVGERPGAGRGAPKRPWTCRSAAPRAAAAPRRRGRPARPCPAGAPLEKNGRLCWATGGCWGLQIGCGFEKTPLEAMGGK